MRRIAAIGALLLVGLALVAAAQAIEGVASNNSTPPPPPSPSPLPPSPSHGNGTHNGTNNNTKPIGFLVAAAAGIPLMTLGYLFLKTTFVLGGFSAAFGLFWVYGPMLFATTAFCCGANGTLTGHLVASGIVGLAGGALAWWLYYVGVFCLGALLGVCLGIGLLLTPLRLQPWASNSAYLAGYFGGLAFSLGSLAVCALQKHVVIAATSLGGALGVALGVEYFVHTNFGDLVLDVLRNFAQAIRADFEGQTHNWMPAADISNQAYYMLGGWAALTVLSMIFQYCIARKGLGRSSDDEGDYYYEKRRGGTRRRPTSRREPRWQTSDRYDRASYSPRRPLLTNDTDWA